MCVCLTITFKKDPFGSREVRRVQKLNFPSEKWSRQAKSIVVCL